MIAALDWIGSWETHLSHRSPMESDVISSTDKIYYRPNALSL